MPHLDPLIASMSNHLRVTRKAYLGQCLRAPIRTRRNRKLAAYLRGKGYSFERVKIEKSQ